jgi:hypothetical protein
MFNDLRFFDDIRYGFRLLAKSPGAAATAILALGLGIGANTACFISLKAMVLRPLPFKDLNRIVTLWESPAQSRTARDPVSPANFLDWKEQAHSYRHLAAYRWWDVNLTGVDDPEHLQGYAVSPEFFPLLGMAPELGRVFARAEAEPGHDQVVVLSHGFWKRRFASDRRVVGRTITLDGRAFTVVGVMPEDFDFPLTTDVWAPLALTPRERAERGARTLAVMGRLAPGIPLAAAKAELTTIAGRLERQYPQTNDGRGAQILRLLEVTNFMTDRFVIILMCSSTFVLLLACANVANIQLARSTARAKELAVRAALGASRWRIARQLLIEALLVSLAGGALAVCLAFWRVGTMHAGVPAQIYKYVAGLREIKVDRLHARRLRRCGATLRLGSRDAVLGARQRERGPQAGRPDRCQRRTPRPAQRAGGRRGGPGHGASGGRRPHGEGLRADGCLQSGLRPRPPADHATHASGDEVSRARPAARVLREPARAAGCHARGSCGRASRGSPRHDRVAGGGTSGAGEFGVPAGGEARERGLLPHPGAADEERP